MLNIKIDLEGTETILERFSTQNKLRIQSGDIFN